MVLLHEIIHWRYVLCCQHPTVSEFWKNFQPSHSHVLWWPQLNIKSHITFRPWVLPFLQGLVKFSVSTWQLLNENMTICWSWALQLHRMPKEKPGDWHSSGDYRALNNSMLPGCYPLPHIHNNFTGSLAATTICSKIDLVKAYNHIPVAPENVLKTAVTTFELFELLPMSFGVQDDVHTSQTFIHKICHSLHLVFAYVDDILVASTSAEEHYQHLRLLLERLESYSFS